MSPDLNKITVVLVLYNSQKKIIKNLEKIKNFKIVIVDNGKNDDIIENLKKFPNIEKILSKNKNLGYGRAINYAVENINTDFFLILNPDLSIDENSVEKLYSTLINNEDCAMVAPVTVPDKDFYGIFPEKGKGVARNKNEIKSCLMLEETKLAGETCVDVAKGCVLLLKKKFFEEVNKFDENYFLFWEEIDLCKKFRERKLSVIINTSVTALHNEGSSSENNILNFYIRNYHKELSPLIYFKNNRFSKFIFIRLFKYFFRAFGYLLILNFKNSLKNISKLMANLNYILNFY